MEQESQAPQAEHTCPITFLIVPAFVGALIWLIVLLAGVGQ
jgi:hypothetical protein